MPNDQSNLSVVGKGITHPLRRAVRTIVVHDYNFFWCASEQALELADERNNVPLLVVSR